MELWVWLVAYLVLFALLHLLLYVFYLNRESRRDSDERTPVPSLTDGSRSGASYPSSPDGYPAPEDHDHDVDGESISCPHCGAPNDADRTFTYCWNCISTLR